MFQKLVELRNKVDKVNWPSIVVNESTDPVMQINKLIDDAKEDDFHSKSLEEYYSFLSDSDRAIVIEFIKYGREYYKNPALDFQTINKLYFKEMNIRGTEFAKNNDLVDYFNQDETMSWIAAQVLDSESFGRALSEAELEYRNSLLEEYKVEIEFVKLMIINNPNFESLTYKNKINMIANTLVTLNEKRNNDKIELD